MNAATGVSFVVPVYNGRRWLREALGSIDAQRDGRPFEIITVDDGSVDGSRRILDEAARAGRVTVIDGPGRGIAAAINAGVRRAQYPIICQTDQDVILGPGWLAALVNALDDPAVAAAQGHYQTAADARFWSRVMSRDLEQRYRAISGADVDHVCTGNTAYRATALHQAGLLDESLGYGSDNDLSYRLTTAGYRLVFRRDALSVHRWRDDAGGYLRQQYGVGYGRLDLVARHPGRVSGDDVSGMAMMAHAPLMLSAIAGLTLGSVARLAGFSARPAVGAAVAILLLLFTERTRAGILAWRHSGDAAALAFGAVHLLRDVAWAAAIVVWTARRLSGQPWTPGHSMRRAPVSTSRRESICMPPAQRMLALVPAYNEALNLTRVVRELQRAVPMVDILVVNDGSTDATGALLPALGVDWLTLPQRLGVGGAVRAGLRYAARDGYDYVVRIDGDGQHRACDIARMLAPVAQGRLDASIGSRFIGRSPRRRARCGRLTFRRVCQAALACCLSLWTRQRFTDPTSGFWLFGPRTVRLLGRHHPTGYAEPELTLFLCRNGLRVGEVPIRMRPRLSGRTSLTASRTSLALMRTILALLIVPIRGVVNGQRHE
jgi:glycosyltransferase involved in cell wall biosynthesis